jgi:hypothetical protein
VGVCFPLAPLDPALLSPAFWLRVEHHWFDHVTTILRMCLCLGLSLVFLATTAQSDSLTIHSLEDFPGTKLIYVSDYFSFIGQDHQGYVAFALDSSRGRDGNSYQAEHLVLLHDEKQGWVELEGNGRYDNTGKELKTIPQSPSYRFAGMPYTGMAIVSESNRLSLKIPPIVRRTRTRHDGSVVSMGTAQAVLTWNGRTISGRVIYESFMMPNVNRLTHTYWDMWNEYQGFYLGMGTESDLYLHSQKSERLAPLMGFRDGFMALNEQTDVMKDMQVEVLGRELAWGFYKWPTSWRITWTGSKGPAVLILTQVSRTSIGNWAIGGFSIAVVTGELEYGGGKLPVYGLVELIM